MEQWPRQTRPPYESHHYAEAPEVFPYSLLSPFIFLLFLTIPNGRLFGCPFAEDESWHDDEDDAQNAATRAKNSKFALAVIQTLLDTSVNNYLSAL